MSINFNGAAPLVYQLDPDEMNVIYLPVQRILPNKKKEAYIKDISNKLNEMGCRHLLIPVMDD